MLTMHAGRLNHILICLPPVSSMSTFQPIVLFIEIFMKHALTLPVSLLHTHRDQLPEIDISENHDFVDSNFKSYEKSINK